jgi:hypothetical protein
MVLRQAKIHIHKSRYQPHPLAHQPPTFKTVKKPDTRKKALHMHRLFVSNYGVVTITSVEIPGTAVQNPG